MDSINRNQTEDNREDLSGREAVEKIKKMVEQSPNCFFCTAASTSNSSGARPMNVRKVDNEGNLWFLSANDSHKNQEILSDPAVKLFFQGSKHSDFLEIVGEAAVSQDRERIKELWEPIIRTWFTDGVDDPRITVIKVTPAYGYYWQTKHGTVVAGIKMVIGAATGQTLDDSIEGRLEPQRY